jgi:hypoxanthine phosphoribosyltransferase
MAEVHGPARDASGAAAPVPGARQVATAGQVREAYRRLDAGIQPLVDDGGCVMLGLLMGGMVPLVQIASRLHGDFVLDYCHLTRYQGQTRGGALNWIQRPRQNLQQRIVVLVDDIFDQGYTLAELARYCRESGARSVRMAVLVRKRHARPVAGIEPDFVGLETGDHYVFGCGMDYQEHWRHLDALWALPDGRA